MAISSITSLTNAYFLNLPGYAWLIVSRFLILLGVYAAQGFIQYYLQDVMRVSDPPKATSDLMAIIGLPLALVVFPAGLLSDRFGRRRTNLLAGALIALGIFLLAFAVSLPQTSIFGAVVDIGTGIFLSANWALATDLIPQEEAGVFLGLTNLATAGASAAARLGGPLIDQVNVMRPGAYLGYPTLFVLASLSVLAGTLLVFRIRELTQPRFDS